MCVFVLPLKAGVVLFQSSASCVCGIYLKKKKFKMGSDMNCLYEKILTGKKTAYVFFA